MYQPTAAITLDSRVCSVTITAGPRGPRSLLLHTRSSDGGLHRNDQPRHPKTPARRPRSSCLFLPAPTHHDDQDPRPYAQSDHLGEHQILAVMTSSAYGACGSGSYSFVVAPVGTNTCDTLTPCVTGAPVQIPYTIRDTSATPHRLITSIPSRLLDRRQDLGCNGAASHRRHSRQTITPNAPLSNRHSRYPLLDFQFGTRRHRWGSHYPRVQLRLALDLLSCTAARCGRYLQSFCLADPTTGVTHCNTIMLHSTHRPPRWALGRLPGFQLRDSHHHPGRQRRRGHSDIAKHVRHRRL